MIKKIFLIATLLLMAAIMVLWAAPVEAGSQHPQAYYQTPTPDGSGKIVYKVKKNDTCLSISLLTGVDLNTLRQLNKLDENCTLSENQELLLAIVEKATFSPSATPTIGPAQPTPTPLNGKGQICIVLFFDTNGNAMPDTDEPPIVNGAFSIQDKENKANETGRTATDPACKEVVEGDYNISVAPPEGFNPTTSMNYAIKVTAGDKHIIPFGAQPSAAIITPQASGADNSSPTPSSDSNLWMLLIGMLLILAGIGLGVYFVFLSRKNRVL